jgi:hypothetical protein
VIYQHIVCWHIKNNNSNRDAARSLTIRRASGQPSVGEKY